MRINVDFAACNGHGECVIEAPEVFDLPAGEDVVVLLEDAVDKSRRDQVERAAAMCPVAAIRLDS